jgi:hypothetical protein
MFTIDGQSQLLDGLGCDTGASALHPPFDHLPCCQKGSNARADRARSIAPFDHLRSDAEGRKHATLDVAWPNGAGSAATEFRPLGPRPFDLTTAFDHFLSGQMRVPATTPAPYFGPCPPRSSSAPSACAHFPSAFDHFLSAFDHFLSAFDSPRSTFDRFPAPARESLPI